ncbi:MAG TPA: zinc-ribbon domain-containing protein [Tepidisphaeraceae bacterium]
MRRGPYQFRGGFIIFGTRPMFTNDSAPPVQALCPSCRQQTTMIARSHRNWFTLYFIPVFPISGKSSFTECSSCHARFQVTLDQLQANVNAGEQQQSQRGIAMYNSLRANPANAITLNELMTLYASMNEFDQAISAARDFPQALHSSEQCMTTLGRVLLAQNQFKDAIAWFDAALTKNPQDPEAHYYKALAHLTSTPPEMAQAIQSARAARSAGHPNADALLKEAEQRDRAQA